MKKSRPRNKLKTKGKRIILIDGTGLVYRAYFAFLARPLMTSGGENTSALFGFLKILIMIIRDLRPDSIVTAFDLSRKTFRQDIYPEYKAQREETPPDLKKQIPMVLDTLKMMNVPVVELENYEADDIIGTLSEKLKKDNEIYIVSSDKDLLQLVGGNVRALRPQHGISEVNLLGDEDVRKSLGVYPSQIPDYLAIVGDTSDNIPGVKGIGEKGASLLLALYHDLDEIYRHIDDIKESLRAKLIVQKDNAYLSRQLACLKLDLPLDENEIAVDLDINSFLKPAVTKMLEHYQLNSLTKDLSKLADKDLFGTAEKRFPASPAETLPSSETLQAEEFKEFGGEYSLITKKGEILTLIEKIISKGYMSLDTETTSADSHSAGLIGISVSLEEGSGVFIPALYPAGQEFDCQFVIETLRKVLENEEIVKIGQNIKFEIEIFRQSGITIRGAGFDTMIAAYLLNPSRARNNLESLVLEYLGFKKKDYSEVLKDVPKKGKNLLDVPIKNLIAYACSDSDAALRLRNILGPMIHSHCLDDVFYKIEIPLISVLAEMEITGVMVDTLILKELSVKLEDLMKTLEIGIYRMAGHEFNISSPPQLSRVLFDEIGLAPVKKTTGGKSSTDEEVLTSLAYIHPLPAEILQYRTYSKLKGTYIDALPLLILERTGRIHTSFNQTIAATGRLSSSDPNLQNIPVRDQIGREIRKAFIADKGRVLISADYSQIELRVLAHFCKDENMLKAFKERLDIHRHTASLIFGVPENEVTEEMRRKAKSVNFGIIYGLQAYGLSKQIGITMGEAKDFINDYFKSFPGVKLFVETVLKEVKDTGEVRTLSGRYRKFPDLLNREIKQSFLNPSQRMALNTKMQGSAADIIKIAMIEMQDYL
ncbi:MAG: DNA polymerase I, partial [Brevinematales bacterium]